MSQEIRAYTVTVPAGTTIADNWSESITFPPEVVDTVEIRIPPGPNGNMGFRLGSSGTPVIPYNSDGWVITNDEVISWSLEDYFDSGAWQVFAYNVGTYDHSIYIRFLNSLVTGSSSGGQYAPSSVLSNL